MSYLSYVCPHDCPRTCALETGRLDKRIICRIKGAKSDSYTARVICAKVVQYSERIRHPKRLLHPRLRAVANGTGKFVDIGCDEALDKVADEFKTKAAKYGNETVWQYLLVGMIKKIQRNVI